MRKLVVILLLCSISAKGYSQLVTLNESNVQLRKILIEIQKQTGYSFSLGDLKITERFTIKIINRPVVQALDEVFKNKPYYYRIVSGIIVVMRSKVKATIPLLFTINGKVEAEGGEEISEASIQIKNTSQGTFTDSKGKFCLNHVPNNSTIQVSSVGYEPKEFVVSNLNPITVKLRIAATGLDETVVIAYGKTSRRLNTGNVFKIEGHEIVDQPVSNFIAAMPGRVPGLLISQKSGIPGTSYNIELRGRASIGAMYGYIPVINTLILVDNIPFSPNNNNLPIISAGAAIGDPGRNSFDLININDIESIDVLKDADATAIYGSRGANGVILVTTKKGMPGKPTVNVAVNSGLGEITRYPDMMNTVQYSAMRRSAILNDGNIPNNGNAPDLFKWDSTRYTNLKKLLIGGTAKINNIHVSISGGNSATQYFLSGAMKTETTVYPGDFSDNTFYSNLALNHHSLNNRLIASLSLATTFDNNNSLVRDLTAQVTLPPNVPQFYDSLGNLVWQKGGYSFINPMATLKQPYHILTQNILSDVNINYTLFKNVALKLNGGINNIKIDESILQPRSSQNTFSIPTATGQAFFAYSKLKSWIIEPQLESSQRIGKGKITALIGGTYQCLNTRITNEAAYGYTNDSALEDISKAKTRISTPTNYDYRYVGVFGRLSYNLLNKYLVNLTGRRDGSSRFGPGHQFGNFGAIGAAWIFSNENAVINHIPFISFGKLRASYGITGSDQIGDYRYLDRWAATSGTYQGDTGIVPVIPANPYYSWEETRKLEGALEIAMFKNQLQFSFVYYLNKTGNQIITQSLPAITGFNQISAANYPAVVQNNGWEINIKYDHPIKKDFNLSSNLLFTIPKNKLSSFPNLSNSFSANKNLYIGRSISSISGFTFTGVDKKTGLFTFKDQDNSGTISYPNDYSILTNQDPKFYGSLFNSITYKNWEFSSLIEFKKQTSYNYLYKIYSNKPPGISRSNQPSLLDDYWQKTDDITSLQKLTASTNSTAYEGISNFSASSGVISDASYIRIKMLAISYNLPSKILKKVYLTKCRFYISSNNLGVLTKFKATDPETVDIFTLPPLRTIALGIHIGF